MGSGQEDYWKPRVGSRQEDLMEKPSCGIIQDLLLSYHDGLTADNITEMLQEHLAECGSCRAKYEELELYREETEKKEVSRGQSFGEKLRSMKYYMIGIAIGMMSPVVLIVFLFLIAEIESYIEMMMWSYSMY